ncbi:uncharacterized protein BDW43DRAFT_316188 [Aspergillus alliaceus]|uniref:uncharacterized protein n=1 Tax=Petromyces alliaceus TaxID=209559 RepID=UPI0012A734AD|nr:uncharacterized protein BDW43DRAFT_316188 [Aspergillus alliaceus]KAB8228085.1 hypothetical protein BDW43DRAFT_316188 [Aspergillus alliaceus]
MSIETGSTTKAHGPDEYEDRLAITSITTTRSPQYECISQSDIGKIRIASTSHSAFRSSSEEEGYEPPKSVIHAPPGFNEFRFSENPTSPPLLTTTTEVTKDWSERVTPRDQIMQGFDEIDENTDIMSLGIIEGTDPERISQEVNEIPGAFNLAKDYLSDGEVELKALKVALAECWSLCHTLANLSFIYRQRSNFAAGMDEAWKSCWRLCQELYACHNEDNMHQTNPTLYLCRNFCQTLFDGRIRENELTDSVLRVSFELNNHFACWSLAEVLFSMRQSKKEGRRLGEELLGSAVQACWELCDIFREGCTQLSFRKSERGTPRPSQAVYPKTMKRTSQSEPNLGSKLSEQEQNLETPTTIFEDTVTVSPEEGPIPNIFVLGQGSTYSSQIKWYPNSSSVSAQTSSSEKTSSTNTVMTLSTDPNLSSLRILVTKAAMNSGSQRNGPQGLPSFVKSLSSDAFGPLPWQISLLRNYKALIAFDPVFRHADPQAQASVVDISRAVQAMVQSGQLLWLSDLYRLVFGFHVEEAVNRTGTVLGT